MAFEFTEDHSETPSLWRMTGFRQPEAPVADLVGQIHPVTGFQCSPDFLIGRCVLVSF